MRINLYYIILFFIAIGYYTPVCSQHYVFKHYSKENGLAGNVVYCVSQDKDGFMWFGTDNGVSRFDGKNFTNFTTERGLTDNEVLEIFSDSRGRTWFVSLSSAICYYYQGKVYSPTTTSSLQMNTALNNVKGIYEDKAGNIWFRGSISYCYTRNNELIRIETLSGNDKKRNTQDYATASILPYGINAKGNFFSGNKKGELIEYINPQNSEKLTSDYIAFGEESQKSNCVDDYKLDLHYHVTAHQVIVTRFINNRLTLVNRIRFDTINVSKSLCIDEKKNELWLPTQNGAMVFTRDFKLIEHTLQGHGINAIFIDSFDNVWCITYGDGIYFLNSSRIRYVDDPTGEGSSDVLSFSIDKEGNILSAIKGKGIIKSGAGLEQNSYLGISGVEGGIKKIFTNKKEEQIIIGNSSFYSFNLKESHKYYQIKYGAIKDVEEISAGQYLIACSNGCYLQNDTIKGKMLLPYRCTAVAKGENDECWVSSIDSLYKIVHQNVYPYKLYDVNRDGRIVSLDYTEGNILWICTYNNGIKAIINDKMYLFNFSNGLLSNQCRSTYFEAPGKLWVITDLGINKIIYNPNNLSQFSIKSITLADGLPSDQVRQLIKRNDTIWVATDKGLVYFNESQISKKLEIPVNITRFEADDSLTTAYNFKYYQNRISIEFTAISFSSGENLRFLYKLEGLDEHWIQTSERRIEYASLKPGRYTFRVKAIDENGAESSNTATRSFYIAPAFWNTLAFRLGIIVPLVLLAIYIYTRRLNNKRRKEVEQSNTDKKFAELKLEAIRSQMSPHFIFNCLNAIQHFNIKNDQQSAQYFMSEFARLIRKTLNHSRADFVVLAEEIELLDTYIKLEKLRFEELFQYEIIISEAVKQRMLNLLVPSLIFQPYVENAIIHGLKYLKNTQGKLTLSFSLLNERLLVKLEDNGIGMEESEKIKNIENKQHQSVGMLLNNSRIDIINRIYDLDIQLSITDKHSINSLLQGTIVEISLPARTNQ